MTRAIQQRRTLQPARYRSSEEIARDQFVRNLVAQARETEKDEAYRSRWQKRQVAVKAAERRERNVLAIALVVFTLLGVAGAVALTMLLMSATGLTFLAALALAVVLAGGGSGCCCIVTVTVVH